MAELEDIAVCIAEGRTPRHTGPYQVAIGDEKLDFRGVQIEDPISDWETDPYGGRREASGRAYRVSGAARRRT